MSKTSSQYLDDCMLSIEREQEERRQANKHLLGQHFIQDVSALILQYLELEKLDIIERNRRVCGYYDGLHKTGLFVEWAVKFGSRHFKSGRYNLNLRNGQWRFTIYKGGYSSSHYVFYKDDRLVKTH